MTVKVSFPVSQKLIKFQDCNQQQVNQIVSSISQLKEKQFPEVVVTITVR